jgi:hypothetical protein
MTTEQMDDTTIEEEKSQKEALRHLDAFYWGGVIVWAGLVFGADSLGYLPQIGGAEAWSWIFLGAGLYALAMALVRVTSPDYPNPTTGDYVWVDPGAGWRGHPGQSVLTRPVDHCDQAACQGNAPEFHQCSES